MIEVKNLVKKYGDHYAVKDLSFTLEEGKIYGFLGPNGAGKSTTMNMMTGYIASTSGEVVINGHDILEEPEEAKKAIGYLPELPPLYMDMTVEEYIQTVAELKKVPTREIPIMMDKVMRIVKIHDMKDRLIKNLSKGYKQRVGIAQALVGYPQVIILDEPTVGLDPKQIIEIRDLILDLGKSHTIILSSHILSEVSAVCDEVLIIAHGELQAQEPTENLGRLFSGGNGVELTVDADENQLRTALAGLSEQIQELTVQSTEVEHGALAVNIQFAEGQDIRKELAKALVANDCGILEMKKAHVSLEDIFLELTQSEQQDAAAEG